jgi:hypothetical protein
MIYHSLLAIIVSICRIAKFGSYSLAATALLLTYYSYVYARNYIKWRDYIITINYNPITGNYVNYPFNTNPKNITNTSNFPFVNRKSNIIIYTFGLFSPLFPLYYYYKHYPTLIDFLIFHNEGDKDNSNLYSNIPFYDYTQVKARKFYFLFKNQGLIGYFTLILLVHFTVNDFTNVKQLRFLLYYAALSTILLLLCDNLRHFWEYSWYSMGKSVIGYCYDNFAVLILPFALIKNSTLSIVIICVLTFVNAIACYCQYRYFALRATRSFQHAWCRSDYIRSSFEKIYHSFIFVKIIIGIILNNYVKLASGFYYLKHYSQSCEYYCRENNGFFYPLAQWLNEASADKNKASKEKEAEFYRRIYAINRFFAYYWIRLNPLPTLVNDSLILRYEFHSKILSFTSKSRGLSISNSEIITATQLYEQNHPALVRNYYQMTDLNGDSSYSPRRTVCWYLGGKHDFFDPLYERFFFLPKTKGNQQIYHKNRHYLRNYPQVDDYTFGIYLLQIIIVLLRVALSIYIGIETINILMHKLYNTSKYKHLYPVFTYFCWVPLEGLLSLFKVLEYKRGQQGKFIESSKASILIRELFHFNLSSKILESYPYFLETEMHLVHTVKQHYQTEIELENLTLLLCQEFPIELACLVLDFYENPDDCFKFDLKACLSTLKSAETAELNEISTAGSFPDEEAENNNAEMPLLVAKSKQELISRKSFRNTDNYDYSIVINDNCIATSHDFNSKVLNLSGYLRYNPLYNSKQVDGGEQKVWFWLTQTQPSNDNLHYEADLRNNIMSYQGTATTHFELKKRIDGSLFNFTTKEFKLILPIRGSMLLELSGKFSLNKTNEMEIFGSFMFLNAEDDIIDSTILQFANGQFYLCSSTENSEYLQDKSS